VLDADVSVPSGLKHPQFVATPLTTDVAALDYAAYMASPEVVQVHSDGRWPVDGFTLSDDLKLVTKHQADHESHRAFTFVLLAPSLSEALGCLYLNPLREYLSRVQADQQVIDAFPPASAMVTFWLRQDQQDTGLAVAVVEATNDWLLNDWPLAMHLFRILPDERSSRTALERLSLPQTRLTLPGEVRPYLWYQPG
jgi:RimJ/RimL family protein N-acetyltransferase